MTTAIHIEQGDLTAYAVDAIVNAANNDLILGGGLAGAIARKGGPDIQAECRRHGPVAVGQAAITGAGNLPARYVIHQASMSLGGRTTAESLAASTRAVLRLAEEHRLRTLAFPATGTGIAGFDLRSCAQIMLREVRAHLAGGLRRAPFGSEPQGRGQAALSSPKGGSGLTDVYFVLFDDRARRVFQEAHEHPPDGRAARGEDGP